MPAYNEEENIEETVTAWYQKLKGKDSSSRLILNISGSKDRTRPILVELQKTHPQLEIIPDKGDNHGAKVIALYDYAIRHGADYIFQTDSDGQTDPAQFDGFWELRDQYDGIFGNRTVRGDGASRAFVEKVVCLLLRLYFGVKIPDANAPFRLMKAETVKQYLYRLDPDLMLSNIMIATYFCYYRERTAFRVITFKPRGKGTNTLDIPKIVKIGFKSLGIFRSFRKEMKSNGRTLVCAQRGKIN